MYVIGDNERFIAPFVRVHREHLLLATKIAVTVDPDDHTRSLVRNDRPCIRQCVDDSLSRLDIDEIDQYYMHRGDPEVPIGETVGAMAELVQGGKVRQLGLREVTGSELRAAHAVHPVAAVQSEWSIFSRDVERTAVPAAAEPGVTFVPYSPLGPTAVRVPGAGGKALAVRGPGHDHVGVLIRDAVPSDWPAILPFLRSIVAAGDTFTYPVDLDAEQARAMWILSEPNRTVVAVDASGTVLGTAKMNANHMGNSSHIASASYMVDPAHSGKGVGRALCEHTLEWARAAGFRGMQFNAVVETNTRAVNLYWSLGFEVLGTVPEGFRHPEKGFVGLHIMYRAL